MAATADDGERREPGHYLWWQRGVVYQVYPRSFQDSNGDGIGDLAGITRRLDYLRWLGVDALWISPIYPSPMRDFGYDVSDYCGIHPLFGTLADFDALLAAAHAMDLKVILDFVPNHTSDRHPWFLHSRSSRGNDKRDWYIWRDPAPDGGPPNNWLSNFGGPAWTYDAATGQYYYHSFLREQPDLNWRNAQVVAAMLDVLRFWLERGVDGFRVDVIWHLIKDDEFRDNPSNPTWTAEDNPCHEFLPVYTSDRPEVHRIIAQMRRLFDSYHERVLIGEIYLPVEKLVKYYGEGLSGAHLPFNFQLIAAPWDARHIAQLVQQYENALPAGGWPNWVLGNHDTHRIATRIGMPQARLAAMLLLTLRGTPTLYYGDEIGMRDVDIPRERVQDPFEKNVPGKGLGRDPERTPMQWSADAGAGFSTAEPWLPLAPDYAQVNVECQRVDADSMLSLYRRLLALRRESAALEIGRFELVDTSHDVLAYARRGRENEPAFAVLLNFSDRLQTVEPPPGFVGGTIAVSTHADRDGKSLDATVHLRPHEGLVVRAPERSRPG